MNLEALIRRAAERHDVDPELVRAVIRQESGFDPYAVSRKGAKGLMQLMPGTAERLGVQDVFDPAENVHGGVKLLRLLLDRYDGDPKLALAAYNAGVGAVESYGGMPPYSETRDYVERVYRSYASVATASGDGLEETTTRASAGAPIILSVGADGSLRFETE